MSAIKLRAAMAGPAIHIAVSAIGGHACNLAGTAIYLADVAMAGVAWLLIL